MQTTLYTCDLCKEETREAKVMFAPKNQTNMTIVDFARKRFNIQDMCGCCFDKFNEMLSENFLELTGRK